MLRSLFFVILTLAGSATRDPASAGESTAAGTVTFQVIARPLPRIQAPADEYFGRYQLSNLSVRNAIHDMTIEGDSPLALPLQVERIAAVQSALAEWADKYPRDPWLPSAMVKFSTFLISKQQPQYERVAMALLSYLQWVYPQTWYGRYARAQLADFELLADIDLAAPAVGALASVAEHPFGAVGIRHHRSK
ncbi:MAG: hypothetical protein M3Z41_06680 [Candidatus Eremiobacteraeota bacterium]|nr:hypothetical protein [Candidatus Eremiobacteraeota bacterium]